jgi:hypothetical protein
MKSRKTLGLLLLVSAMGGLFLFACAGKEDSSYQPVGPSRDVTFTLESPSPGAWFPLELGNSWQYERTFTLSQGGIVQETFHSTVSYSMTEVEELFGREYVVMECYDDDIPSWIRYRQDQSGLYEADVAIKSPPADSGERVIRRSASAIGTTLSERILSAPCNASIRDALRKRLEVHEQIRALIKSPSFAMALRPGTGVLPEEITRLSYPLHRGASWLIRDDPPFVATVEGRDVLDLPFGKRNAVRVRIDPPQTGNNYYRVLFWYGRCGELRSHVVVEGEFTREDGSTQWVRTEDEQVLVSASLSRNACGGVVLE